MIKLELTEAEYKNILLKYELGDLLKSNIIEEEGNEIIASSELHQKLCKAGVDGGSKESVLENNNYNISESLVNEVDDIYDAFIEYILTGEFEKDMEAIYKEIEEGKKKGDS